MNNAFIEAGLLTPMEPCPSLVGRGIIITFVWKQMAFSTLLISGAMAALDDSQIRAARNLGASRFRILFQIILAANYAKYWCSHGVIHCHYYVRAVAFL